MSARARSGAASAGRLLEHLLRLTDRPVLVGTWAAAYWAVAFYEKQGFTQVTVRAKDAGLRKYWDISERQVETSVVLADERALGGGAGPAMSDEAAPAGRLLWIDWLRIGAVLLLFPFHSGRVFDQVDAVLREEPRCCRGPSRPSSAT